MSLPNWKSIPVCIRRSRRKLYNLVATEFSLTSYESLDVSVRRSNRKLYNYVASQLNLNTWDELDVPLRRSTHLLYNYVKGCSSTQTLTVTVTDESSVAISGASVVIGETSKSTGDDGKATFQLAYGDYEATVSADGYATVTEELAFRSNHKNFEIELEAETPVVTTGTVTVTCQDSEENPVENATVVLSTVEDPQSLDEVVGAGITDNTGTVTLETVNGEGQPSGTVADVTFGTYYLSGTNMEIRYSGTLVVDGDETVTITLTE